MADTDVKTLQLQIDASVELLRAPLNSAQQMLTQLEQRTTQTSARVDQAFQRMGKSAVASAGQQRMAMQQLSYQLNDVATMWAMGARPMQIFASQSGQVVQAIQMMSGGTSKLAGFLGGPWGMAITTATVVLAPFISKLFNTGNAADVAADKVYGLSKAIADLRSKPMEALGNLQVNVATAEGALTNARNMPRYTGGGSEEYKRNTFQERARNAAISAAEAALRNARADLAVAQFAAKNVEVAYGEKPARKRVSSSGSVAHQAEAARVKVLDEDSAYTSAERQARHALLEATRKTTASEEARDALLREDINAEAEAAKRRIANDLSAKKLTAEQAAHLTDLAEQTRTQKLLNVDLARRSQIIRDAAEVEAQGYDNQIAILRLQEGFATTIQQRRDIQKQILAAETRNLIRAQQAIIDDPLSTTNQVLDAIGKQQQARKELSLGQANIDHSNQMPMEEYAQRLKASTADMTEAFQNVQANGLQSLEDGIVDVISGAHSMGDAFKNVANQIIADLARIAIRKMIVAPLAGMLGFSEGGEVKGYATGGFISGAGTGTSDSIPAMLSNGEYVMTAAAVKRIGVNALDMMNSGRALRFAEGGLVAPRMPRMQAANNNNPGGGVTIPITINAPGATAETVSMMRREMANWAPTIIQAATAHTTREMNRRRL